MLKRQKLRTGKDLNYICLCLCFFCSVLARAESRRLIAATWSGLASLNFWRHFCCRVRRSSELKMRNLKQLSVLTLTNSSDRREASSGALGLVHEKTGSKATTALCCGKIIKTTTDVVVFWITTTRPDLSSRPRCPCIKNVSAGEIVENKIY